MKKPRVENERSRLWVSISRLLGHAAGMGVVFSLLTAGVCEEKNHVCVCVWVPRLKVP